MASAVKKKSSTKAKTAAKSVSANKKKPVGKKAVKTIAAKKAVSAKAKKSANSSVAPAKAANNNVLGINDNVASFASANGYAQEVKKAGEKLFSASSENVKQFMDSAQASSKSWEEFYSASCENNDAAKECSEIASSIVNSLIEDSISHSNEVISKNIELSKNYLDCANISDVLDLNNEIAKANIEAFFTHTINVAEKLFTGAEKVSEPVNESISEVTQRLAKTFSDCSA